MSFHNDVTEEIEKELRIIQENHDLRNSQLVAAVLSALSSMAEPLYFHEENRDEQKGNEKGDSPTSLPNPVEQSMAGEDKT